MFYQAPTNQIICHDLFKSTHQQHSSLTPLGKIRYQIIYDKATAYQLIQFGTTASPPNTYHFISQNSIYPILI